MALITYFPVVVSLFTIAFVFFLIAKINKAPVAKGKALAITEAIKEGAISYLKRQYKTVSMVAAVLFFIL
ncbi:MAG: membrane-bound proton-translocating pyrophosphatase, partial [Parcubacteria group bacterium GW2011_GWA2_33_14]